MKYRVVNSTIIRGRGGERCNPGDVIEPTEAELRAFGDNLELVNTDSNPVSDTITPGSDDEICGVEMSNGETCDRLAVECPYHAPE